MRYQCLRYQEFLRMLLCQEKTVVSGQIIYELFHVETLCNSSQIKLHKYKYSVCNIHWKKIAILNTKDHINSALGVLLLGNCQETTLFLWL